MIKSQAVTQHISHITVHFSRTMDLQIYRVITDKSAMKIHSSL